ncbi:Chemotaxis protein CheA [Gemmata obscuriglobus]|uniref:HPt domain-containing protein n=1 Tax=Gemmata obscuriglobus TaxID=114 RepID=A0A2Z3GZW2_9BACT
MPVEMDQLLNTFLDEAGEHLAALESGLLGAGDGAPDPEVLNAVFRAAHSIKGGSGVFGFEAITRLTHSLEQLLDKLRKGQLPVTRDRIDLLLRAVDGLHGLFAAARAGEPASADADLVVALNTAAGCGSGAVEARPPAVAPGPQGAHVYRVTITPGPRLLTDGMDPLLLLRNLGKHGELLEVSTDLGLIPDLESLDPNRCYLSWVATVRTTETAGDLKGVFRFVEDECAVSVTAAAGARAAHFGARLAEYEGAYGALLSWVMNRLPELREHDRSPRK